MRTMILQYAVSLLTLAFGVTGFLAARQVAHPIGHCLAWQITGAAFTAAGMSKVAQNGYGTLALVAGRGSPTWNTYLEWAPVFDHGRTGLLATSFLLLAVLLVPHRSYAALSLSGLPARTWTTVLAAGALVGALAGWVQGWGNQLHFRNVTLSDTAELILVLGTLLALLLRERVDGLLWMALALYGAKLAMNVMWISAWMQTEEANFLFWLTNMHVGRIVATALMLALAGRRLVLARRGALVPGLLSSLPLRGGLPRRMF